jgi:uncharacterized phage protein (TIGR02220 family)
MAINYGYFRHRFDAHLNEKLNKFADKVGLIGFAYYYLLLEIYGTYINNNEDRNHALIHPRTLANIWRKRVDSVHLVMTKLQLSELLVFTLSEQSYEITIPNFLKYYGSYKKTTPQIKENKTKENKTKQKEETTTANAVDESPKTVKNQNHELDNLITEIINYFNQVTGKNLRPTNQGNRKLIIARLNENYSVDDFKAVINNMNSLWRDDPKMKNYIQPSTLFSNKFDQYLNTTPKETFEQADQRLADYFEEALAKMPPPEESFSKDNGATAT